MSPTRKPISRNPTQMDKGQKAKTHKNLQNFLVQEKMHAGRKNVSGLIVNQTTDEYFSVEEHNFIYTGIPNETATKLVLMLMGFIISLIFLCMFLIAAVYIYYKGKSNGKSFTATEANVKTDKANSPYIVTPEQKITQQLLSSEMVTPIECSASDIAQLVRYMALYGKFTEDEIYRTPQSCIRLVIRGKTKFDSSEMHVNTVIFIVNGTIQVTVSKNEQKTTRRFSSRKDLSSDKQNSTLRAKSRKSIQQQGISSSKPTPRKKARRKQFSDELNYGSGAKRSSRRGNAAEKQRKVKDGEKIKSKLNRRLVEISPSARERPSRKWKKRKHLRESKRHKK
ncbi:unnamed protein product [Litomosoides sigmodontis]|uniref:Uncharacterized protein n=1 Tax=Litomosoides sigmodontis TaxID=42156 RepID=A0A3P6SCE8_LITSI|nr:unnamed protein product [Litomosoides sigmodontis]